MQEIKEYVTIKKEQIKAYVGTLTLKPKLVIVQVNEDKASCAYVNGKLKDLNEIGAIGELIKLDTSITQEELLNVIKGLNEDETVDGFIVQMPLPSQIDEEIIKRSVDPIKDVDGFNPLSTYLSATPKGILTYLEDNNFDFSGKNAVILGRSNIVGRPMHDILLNKNMNVTILHSKTNEEDRKFYIEHASLIVVAIGKKYYLDNRYNYRDDCVVMDVGINRDIDNHLYGDCIPTLNVKFQSPVPRGVGLLTRLSLTLNLIECYKRRHNL
ncbi:MAG: bifunctional 5,10-methylenetetrahydrofolate dehydrogenase/5,10-methenyltetrahydrofolate cyclohydrolase [Mollicutes bacterium]|nr:bifunctional 5,10-methylenetetrahydrofolate dehydrogenase/5,10-methenyltetrahydrofolate cyclohydrolase [Mollicutes bacterium]